MSDPTDAYSVTADELRAWVADGVDVSPLHRALSAT